LTITDSYDTAAASKAATMFTIGLGVLSARGIGTNSEYHRLMQCFQFNVTMAIAMMSSERKPPSMLPSQDEAPSMIGDFSEMSVSNSNDDLHFVQVMNARLNGRISHHPEVETWRRLLPWVFLLFLLFCLLIHMVTSWISAQYKRHWHGFLPPSEKCQVEVEFPHAPGPPKGCPEWY